MKYQIRKNLGATLRHNGVDFCVWAPFAKQVYVATPYTPFQTDNKLAMDSDGEGYWSLFVAQVRAGQSYKYIIETESGEFLERNDPRARVLTDSDRGTAVVTANDFDWGDDFFMPIPKEKQIVYEMHIGTFNRPDASTAGTFKYAIEKLDHLVELGINMIELMPTTSMVSSSNGWGYAPNYIFSVESNYGGRYGMMEFVKACHQHGMGVILDIVYNHFIMTDLWQFDGWSENDRGGIYFYNDSLGDTPWGGRPDYGRPEVRQFILDNVVMWFSEYRVDGLRLDSTAYMRNTNGQDDPAHDVRDAWSLLGEITKLAHKIHPGSLIVAEDTSVNSYITKHVRDGGCGFDAQWGLNFSHALKTALGLQAPYPADLKQELVVKYNNDVFERVIFSDSHDTAANGSVRINEAVTPGNAASAFARHQTLLAGAITMTSPGIPMLLQGQEFMQGGNFNAWQELEWPKAEQFSGIVTAHRNLIDLRLNKGKKTAGLQGQSICIFHQDDDNSVLAYQRWNMGGPGDDVIVIANFGDNKFLDYSLTLPLGGVWQVRFNSSWKGYSQDFSEVEITSVTTDDNRRISIPLTPYGVLIFSQDPAKS